MAEWASVLVGRQAELQALGRALVAVERGAARSVALRGEPGIGKSRLLGELARRARERGLLVLEGRAAELERDLTFALLVEALEPLVDRATIEELEGWQRRELAAVLPGIGAEAGPVSGERHRVARAVRVLLERSAAERPLALLLDDIHWADPASADVLALLVFRPPRAGVLLGLAARSRQTTTGLGSAFAAVQQRGGAEVLELGPLPFELIEPLVPGVGAAARKRLYRESGGNPFYLEELLRAAPPAPGGGHATAQAGVPRAVHAALAAEVAALSAAGRRVLEGAAVVGDPFGLGLAGAAADVDEPTALRALDELLAAELVRPTGRPRWFRFRHPLVRRAVYEGAGGGWRLAAHARAAKALGERGASPAQRAHHVERAARAGDQAAVELLSCAAEEVTGAAPETAAGWYEAALRLLPETDPRRLTLLRSRAQALVSAGRPGDACAVLRQVLAVLGPDAVAERAEATVMLAGQLAVWTQQPDEARRLLHAERVALSGLEPGLRAGLDLASAEVHAEFGDHAGSEALADRARAEARAAGDGVLEAAAAARAADAAHCRLRGDDPGALAAVDAKIAAAAALVQALPDDRVAQRLSMLVALGIAQTFTGRLRAASATFERGLGLARSTGQGLFAPAFVAGRGVIAEFEGRFDVAEACAEEVLESALVSENAQVAYWASISSSSIALARGQVEAALAHAHTAWELVGTRPCSQVGFSVADARLAAGDPNGALAALDAFEWVSPQLWTFDRVRAAEVAVRVLLALGRVQEAAALASRAPAEGGGRRSGVFGAVLAHADAVVRLAQGEPAEAARMARGGVAAAGEASAPVWGARCRILVGEALLAAGRTADARRELRAAAAELEARGAWGYRDAALRLLRRLGDRPRPAAAAPTGDVPLAALTPRERQVAALVADGQTNAQIAARLQISESTVEKHVSRALGKLGMSTRAGLIRSAFREGATGGSGVV